MKNKRSLVCAGLVAAALLPGASNRPEAASAETYPTAEIVANDPQTAATFTSIQKYWADRKVAPAPGATLTTARRGLLLCDGFEKGAVVIVAIEATKAVACDPKTIIVSEKRMDDYYKEGATHGIPSKTVGAVAIAHEYGHLIQSHLSIEGTPSQQELRADCLGGMAIAAIDKDALVAAKRLYGAFQESPHHSSPAVRTKEFTHGYRFGAVDGCGILPPVTTG